MLNTMRQRIAAALGEAKQVLLGTSGPAGIQLSRCPCTAVNLDLYLLVPKSSEHLVNVEVEPAIVVMTDTWRLRGRAELTADWPEVIPMTETTWNTVIRVRPQRFEFIHPDGAGAYETFDLD